MKQIENVSIAGISFSIEQDAYIRLQNYLTTIDRQYSSTADGKEIVADIEARIAEIVLENQKDVSVVITLPLIEKVIAQLGMPDSDWGESTPKIARRLYRNIEGSLLGGVCNGLATFFDISVAYVRLIALGLLVLSMFGIESLIVSVTIAYIIAWIAIPAARTARQKLEMRGQEITVSSLEHNIRREFQDVIGHISERGERSASIFATLLYGIGRFILIMLRIVAIFISFILVMILVASLVVLVLTVTRGSEIIPTILDMSTWKAVTLVGLTIVIPITVSIWLIIKSLLNIRGGKVFVTSISGVWVISTVLLFISAGSEARHFKSKAEYTQTETTGFAADTMYVKYIYADNMEEFINTRNPNLEIGDPAIRGLQTQIYVNIADRTAPDSTFMLDINRRSRGTSVSAARSTAAAIDVQWYMSGDTLIIRPYFTTDRNNKWRQQQCDVYVVIPAGKELIYIDGNDQDTDVLTEVITDASDNTHQDVDISIKSNGKGVTITTKQTDREDGKTNTATIKADSTGVEIKANENR